MRSFWRKKRMASSWVRLVGRAGRRTANHLEAGIVKRRSRVGLAMGLAIGLAGITFARSEETTRPGHDRPSIVFLYTDDQAQWAMGAYGNREIRTPNLDRLARQGALFRNAFTLTPACSPPRARLMSAL